MYRLNEEQQRIAADAAASRAGLAPRARPSIATRRSEESHRALAANGLLGLNVPKGTAARRGRGRPPPSSTPVAQRLPIHRDGLL
jgi:hypothetical protein